MYLAAIQPTSLCNQAQQDCPLADNFAKSRNLLLGCVPKQVPRLRSARNDMVWGCHYILQRSVGGLAQTGFHGRQSVSVNGSVSLGRRTKRAHPQRSTPARKS